MRDSVSYEDCRRFATLNSSLTQFFPPPYIVRGRGKIGVRCEEKQSRAASRTEAESRLPPGLGGTKTQFAKNRFAVLARKKPEAFLRLSPSPSRGEKKLTQAELGREAAGGGGKNR